MNDIIKTLQIWHDDNHHDHIRLSRHAVITILTEIERLQTLLDMMTLDRDSRIIENEKWCCDMAKKAHSGFKGTTGFYHMIGNETHDGNYEDCTICRPKRN